MLGPGANLVRHAGIVQEPTERRSILLSFLQQYGGWSTRLGLPKAASRRRVRECEREEDA